MDGLFATTNHQNDIHRKYTGNYCYSFTTNQIEDTQTKQKQSENERVRHTERERERERESLMLQQYPARNQNDAYFVYNKMVCHMQ